MAWLGDPVEVKRRLFEDLYRIEVAEYSVNRSFESQSDDQYSQPYTQSERVQPTYPASVQAHSKARSDPQKSADPQRARSEIIVQKDGVRDPTKSRKTDAVATATGRSAIAESTPSKAAVKVIGNSKADGSVLASSSNTSPEASTTLSVAADNRADNFCTVNGITRRFSPLTNNLLQHVTVPKPLAKGRGRPPTNLHLRPKIFQNLAFFFFPNNENSKPRAIRIHKSLEYGAVWVKEWHEGVTHVVADALVTYSDLIKHVGESELNGIIIVNEQYPAACISNRYLLDPITPTFAVLGAPAAAIDSLNRKQSARSPAPDSSLPLKPSKRQKTTPRSSPIPERRAEHAPPILDRAQTDLAALEVPSFEHVSIEASETGNDPLTAAINHVQNQEGYEYLSDDESEMPVDSDARMYKTQSRILKAAATPRTPSATPRHANEKATLTKGIFRGFQCQEKHDGSEPDNPNARTIEILGQMKEIYEREQDQWRSLAYRKAISALKKTKERIETYEQAKNIPNIGHRLAAKIEEIVSTDKLERLQSALDDPREQTLRHFIRIYGVGPKIAANWVEAGYKTYDDLKEHVKLSPNQLIGIEHADDFEQRIPRKEIEFHEKYVRDRVKSLDPEVEVTVMGSYRRGAKDSGDIDFIFTKPGATVEYLQDVILKQLHKKLTASGYIKCTLTDSSKADSTKWHGACALSKYDPWRRVDFLIVPWEELGAAMIYFTGNDIFNRSLRLLAGKKGYRLNQRGLYKNVMRGSQRAKVTEGELVESRSERKIFEILGVPWREPGERNC